MNRQGDGRSQEHVYRHTESEQRTGNRLDMRIARSHGFDGSQDFTGDVKVQGIDPHGLCKRFNQPSQQRGQYGAQRFGLTWPFTLLFCSLRLLHHYRQYFNLPGFQITWCCVKHLTVIQQSYYSLKHNNINHQIINILNSRQHVSTAVGHHQARLEQSLGILNVRTLWHPISLTFLITLNVINMLMY